MEPKPKKTRWGCIIGIIVIVLLIPVAIVFGPWIYLGFIAGTYQDSDDIRREATTFMTQYEDVAIENEADFVEIYSELARHIVEVPGFTSNLSPHLDIEDVYSVLGEPTAVYNKVTRQSSDSVKKHVYDDYYPYVGEIDERRINNVYLDYYTENYYEADELDALFFQALNNALNNSSDIENWLEETPPSKLRQSTHIKDRFRSELYFLSDNDINQLEQLSMGAFEGIFEMYPDLKPMGEEMSYPLNMTRIRDQEPIDIDHYLHHLISDNDDERYALSEFGTTVSEVSESLGGEPYYYGYDGRPDSQLEVYWRVTNGNRHLDLMANIEIDGESDLTKEKIQTLPINTLERQFPDNLIEWREVTE